MLSQDMRRSICIWFLCSIATQEKKSDIAYLVLMGDHPSQQLMNRVSGAFNYVNFEPSYSLR